jgi:hypothetical protein
LVGFFGAARAIAFGRSRFLAARLVPVRSGLVGSRPHSKIVISPANLGLHFISGHLAQVLRAR